MGALYLRVISVGPRWLLAFTSSASDPNVLDQNRLLKKFWLIIKLIISLRKRKEMPKLCQLKPAVSSSQEVSKAGSQGEVQIQTSTSQYNFYHIWLKFQVNESPVGHILTDGRVQSVNLAEIWNTYMYRISSHTHGRRIPETMSKPRCLASTQHTALLWSQKHQPWIWKPTNEE